MLKLRLISLTMLCLVCTRAYAQGYTVSVEGAPAPIERAAPNDQLTSAKLSDDELVVLDITSQQQVIAQGITGYATKAGLLLPLGQIAEALEFPIRVSVKDGTAAGWAYSESNVFSLNAGHGEAVIGGEREAIDPNFISLQSDDIYIDSKLLSKWFRLDLNFKFSDLTVDVVPHKGVKLPFMLASEAERRRSDLENRGGPQEKIYPLKRVPYELASAPFVDVNSQTSYDHETFRQQTSALGTGDLLYMHNDTYLNMEKARVADLRVTLSRRDEEGKLFSPDEKIAGTWLGRASDELQLRELQLGDIYSSQLPLTGRNQSGRGITISNAPADRISGYNLTTIEGDILPQWDVELYRNDELLSFQRASGEGRYEFQDVPLLSGTNIIRLAFYGPQGEQREEVRQILVRPDLTKKGESYFRATAMQQDNSLLRVREINRTSLTQGVGLTPSEIEAIKGKLRSSLEYEYGLLDNVALYASAVTLPTGDGDQQRYGTLGLGTSLWGVYTRGDMSLSPGNGRAYQGLLQTNLHGVTLSAKHQYFTDMLSDYTGNVTDPLRQYSEVRADTPLRLGFIPDMNIGVANAWNDYVNGRRENELSQRTSMYLMRGLYLSHELFLRNISNVAGSDLAQKDGRLTVSSPIWGVQVRGAVAYDIDPGDGIRSAQLSFDHYMGRDLSLHGQVDHETQNDLTTYSAGFSRHVGKILVGLSASYDSDHQAGAFMNIGFSFGRHPTTRDWRLFPDNTARAGIVYPRAYHDRNNNGVFDAGDAPIERASFTAEAGGRALTNESGMAMVQGLRTETSSNVELEEDSLEDAYWVVKDKGYAVAARAGTPAYLDFAVVGSGDIEGEVYVLEEGRPVVASNVVVQLIDTQGAVVRETRSTFDGYYLMDRVPVGRYSVRVSPEQLARRGMISDADHSVEIKENSAIKFDLTLMRVPEDEVPQDNAVMVEIP